MTEGLKKEVLVNKRKSLIADISSMEADEKEQSAIIHKATSEKARLKALIVQAKNMLPVYDRLISECGPIKASILRG